MIIQPKVRGFICTTAHPTGCFKAVEKQMEYVKKHGSFSGAKNVLVIGASTGYGLASRIVATFGMNAKTIGIFYEKEADTKRTASAGWYNSAAFETLAHQQGYYAKSINGDAFSQDIKARAATLIRNDLQKIDLIIYSLASPRRIHPLTGQTHSSVLKPIRHAFSSEVVFAAMRLILVVGGWFLVGYFIVPTVFRKMAKVMTQETLTIISVALCLILVCVAAEFDYSAALGAFIMGSILAETTLIHRIEILIRPIRDIFAAVFFIAVGMLIDPAVIIHNWPVVLLISAVTIFGKVITTSLASLLTGQSLNTSVRIGFSMAQVGEFSFIIAALGLALHVTNSTLYPIIVAVSGITTFTTPYLIRFSARVGQQLEKHLPDRAAYFLESYSAWMFRTQAVLQKNASYRVAIIRLLLNGIIVAIVFTLARYVVFNRLLLLLQEKWLTNLVCLLIALIVASPFIWGMLFSFKVVKMSDQIKTHLNPLVYLVWLVTYIEIVFLSLAYFHAWLIIILFVFGSILFFAFSYKQLEKFYHWFEHQLVSNINTQVDSQKRYEELAPWDTHLVEIEVGEHSPFVGKTLAESQIRQTYHVNIVAIANGSRIIAAPRGEEKIMANDKLIILGKDKHIELFQQHLSTLTKDQETMDFLSHFALKALFLNHHHPFIGKTIRNSKLREQVNGLVVGLERNKIRILNPDSDIYLQAEDLLLIVGEFAKLKHL